jgi:hypothetical protein
MASASARRAWNDAMKATAGAAALPPALQQGNSTKRRSDRHRKQDRRIKARKRSMYGSSSNSMSAENQADHDYRVALWVDMLEGIDPTANTASVPDDDEEYDELEEFEESTKKRKKRTSANKRETKKGKSQVVAIPKRYLPKSLGSILLEEAYRPASSDDNDSEDEINAARHFIASEARIGKSSDLSTTSCTASMGTLLLPRRKFCPVTGSIALYTEPKSGIPFTTIRALEQIRERAPVWMMTMASSSNSNGIASYYEAVKSIEER